jgi:hypothetical protein
MYVYNSRFSIATASWVWLITAVDIYFKNLASNSLFKYKLLTDCACKCHTFQEWRVPVINFVWSIKKFLFLELMWQTMDISFSITWNITVITKCGILVCDVDFITRLESGSRHRNGLMKSSWQNDTCIYDLL